MNFYCNSGGTIFHVDPERIFQGSAGVNTIRFIGRFPSSAQVLLAYKLPNGNLTSPQVLTLVDELAEVEAPDNGGKFSVWETVLGAVPRLDSNGRVLKDDNGNVVYDLDFTITENYGTATLQFFVYAASNSITVNGQVYNVKGGLLATASSNFTIENGAPALIPTVGELTSTDARVLLAEILNIISSNQMAYNNFTQEVTDKITAIEGSVNTALEEVAQVVENDKAQDEEIAEIRELVENAEQVAKGVQLAVSYADYSAMITALNALSANSYDVGQSIYIATLNVPDLWVYAIEATAVPYTYTSDEDFINSLLANGFVQAGHYKLAALETGKVAIGDYLEKSEFNEYLLNGLTNYPTEWTDEDKTKACETIGAVQRQPNNNSGWNRAYGMDSMGNEIVHRVANGIQANTIVMLGANGVVMCGPPSGDNDATNKDYVDNLPDYLTLTPEQKAKWQKFIGSKDIQPITKAEYDALETIDPDIVYAITDDTTIEDLETKVANIENGTKVVGKASLLKVTSGYSWFDRNSDINIPWDKTGLYHFRIVFNGGDSPDYVLDLGTLYITDLTHSCMGTSSVDVDWNNVNWLMYTSVLYVNNTLAVVHIVNGTQQSNWTPSDGQLFWSKLAD